MFKKVKNILKFVLPALLFGFIFFNIYQNKDLVLSFWSDFNAFLLVMSFTFMLIIYLEAAFNYHVLIKALNFPLDFRKSLYIFIVSNASRYIPGSVWQYIGRVEMAKNIGGVPRNISVLSLILEVFLLVNAALIVSLIALPFFRGELDQNYYVIFLIPFSLIFLHPKIAGFLIKLATGITKKNIVTDLAKFNFKGLVSVLPYFILNFLLNGFALFFLTKSIFPELGLENLLLFAGIFAFSWVIGYLSFLTPAGLGVSDLLLTYLLSFQMPFALASTIALSYRVLLMIAELVIFAFVMRINSGTSKTSLSKTKKAWETRSKKFGFKVEGVATKSLPPLINAGLDNWMLKNIVSAVNSLNSRKSINILDLGCGYGRLSKPLLKKFSKARIYGVDISKNYVDLYNKDLKPRGNAIEGDIRELPFRNKFFDVVFIVTTLMYLTNLDDQERAVKEMMRVLKAEGTVVIIERSPSGYFLFTFGGLVNLIRGKKNQEIPAASIDKNRLLALIKNSGGKIETISGIPFLSLFMPPAVLIGKINSGLINYAMGPINSLDKKFKSLLSPSLYLSYTVSKSVTKK